MHAYKDGASEALREIYRRYAPLITRIAHKRGLRTADAADVCQQTFLQLHRARFDFDGTRLVRPWLLTIARNETISLLRRRKDKDQWASLDDRSELETEMENAEQQLQVQQDYRALEQHVSALPESMRVVIELHVYEDLPFPEVAAVLGVTVAAVKVRAHRAYEFMRSAQARIAAREAERGVV